MNEDQKKWLLYLHDKGVRIDLINLDGTVVERNIDPFSGRKTNLTFAASAENYRLHAQPIPDIPDWRELCREMQSNDVLFSHQNPDGIWVKSHFHEFAANEVRDRYQIPQQPIPEWREELNFEIEDTEYPIWTEDMLIKVENRAKSFLSKLNPSPIADQEWREEMTEETKPDPREEIPHREQQIQWHKDWLHALETGEKMREWQVRLKGINDDWITLPPDEIPDRDKCEYRRKPRTITYWSCVAIDDGMCSLLRSFENSEKAQELINERKKIFKDSKFGPITETTVEMED